MADQLRLGGVGAVGRHHPGPAHLAEALVGHARDIGLADRLVVGEPLLDLLGRDQLAADLEQLLAAPGQFEVAVRADPAQVAGAQPAVRVDQLGGALGVVEVAARHDRAAHAQLPLGAAGQHGAAERVDGPVAGQHAVRLPGRGRAAQLGPADRAGHHLQRITGQGQRGGRGDLGLPVPGEQHARPQPRHDLLPQPDGRRRGRGHHRLQAGQVVVVPGGLVDHRDAHRGHEQHLVDGVPLDGRQHAAGVEHRVRHHRAAGEHRREQPLDVAEHVVHRQREADPPAVGERPVVGRAVGAAQHHVVGQHGAQRISGRAGGEHDVAGPVRVHLVGEPPHHGRVDARAALGQPGQVARVRPGGGRDQQDVAQVRKPIAAATALPARHQLVQYRQPVHADGRVDADQHGGPRSGQHGRQLFGPVGEVHRYRRGAQARDRQLGRGELRPVVHDQRHGLPRPHADGVQAARQPHRPVAHLRVRVGGRVGDDERAVRMAAGMQIEPGRQPQRPPPPLGALQPRPPPLNDCAQVIAHVTVVRPRTARGEERADMTPPEPGR